VAGFVSNVANYSATVEPFFQASTLVNGTPARQSKWVDWNSYVDEQSFASAWKTAMVGKGMSDTIGMLIDTSRNGWGGSSRPTQPSTSTDLNTFVNESRIDRRARVGNWCNQMGAGLGARPQVVESNGIQAYVWIKPPGESDGATLPSPEAKGFDPMCNPAYEAVPTSALPKAPNRDAWFSAQFQELMANAYPPLEPPVSDTVSPSAPSNLAASNVASTSVTLYWGASTDNVGVIAYDVYRDAALVVSVQGSTATVTALDPRTTYTFTVRARDAAGNVSTPSMPLTRAGSCCGTPNPPSVPANVTASKVTYTGVTLSWTASTDEVGMGEYELFEGGVIIGRTKSTLYEVTGLQPGTTHTFTVRAVNTQSMHSAESSPVTVRTLILTVPAAATNLRWSALGGTVTLCWDAPEGWNELYRYRLLYGNFNLGEFGETCVTLIGFKPGTPYYFTIKTVDADGNVSVASNQVAVLLDTPLDTTPPTAPTGFTGSVLSSSSVRLTWTASKDDVGVMLYQIYSSGALLQTVVGGTSATVTKLTVGQAYTFTVKAVDAAGNSSGASSALTLTSMAIDASAPTNLRVSDRGHDGSALVLSWDPPSAGEAVVGYEVHRSTTQKDYLVERTSITSAVVTVTGELNETVVATYYVNAIHAAGDLSPASGTIAVTFRVGGDPLPLNPTPEFKAIATTSTTATFTWSRTSSSCSIWYGVYSDNVLMALTAGTTATVSSLTAGKSYVFKVIARDSCSQAGVSAAITIKPGATLDTTPPSTPSNLKVTANTGSGGPWLLTWSAATDNVGVVGYDLYCRTVYSGMLYLTTLDTTKTATDVNYGSGTVCTVRARDAVGNSSYDSNSVTFP
jgi:chitodextrinase